MTADTTELVRGSFRDDYRTYTVRASSAHAPDSFQVIAGGRDDIVLIITGLNSGDLKATWGQYWARLKPQDKIWLEEQAFRVFYRGRRVVDTAAPTRFCNG
ncbi:hypothetical protein SAMN05216298_3488 [Glycomyces sambucus]|uniref:Uncharacterized protein n=1 Tax=Glycomyces sambucus TaxID=380244 RepID=A0A1G9J898_9ACTN|nr:hypothetical protein [Glycomyces sambucus]SDL33770.1 hypothetical protein SAMN05216298_3488 [Glycomyces sambucus]